MKRTAEQSYQDYEQYCLELQKKEHDDYWREEERKYWESRRAQSETPLAKFEELSKQLDEIKRKLWDAIKDTVEPKRKKINGFIGKFGLRLKE